MHGYAPGKDEYLRLRPIDGQVRGLQAMVASDKYCIDILRQVSAVTTPTRSREACDAIACLAKS